MAKKNQPETDCLLLTELLLPPDMARASRKKKGKRGLFLGAALVLISATGLLFSVPSLAKGRRPLGDSSAAVRAVAALLEAQAEARAELVLPSPSLEEPASAPAVAPEAPPKEEPKEAPKARPAAKPRPPAAAKPVVEEKEIAAPKPAQPPAGQPSCDPEEIICNLETQEPSYPERLSQQEIDRVLAALSFDSCRVVGRGKVTLFGTFDASGKVIEASATVVGAEDGALATCASLRLRSARFPRLSGGTQSFTSQITL